MKVMDLVLNKNFYNYVGCIMFGGGDGSNQSIGTTYVRAMGYHTGQFPCVCTAIDGTAITNLYFRINSSSPNTSYNHSLFSFNYSDSDGVRCIKFICGSGTTAATVDDTALVTPNSNITATIDTGKRDTANSMIFTVTFSASTEQILNEIGLVRELYTGIYYPTLLGRAVLDEPVTLDSEHSLTLQIRLSLPIPQ